MEIGRRAADAVTAGEDAADGLAAHVDPDVATEADGAVAIWSHILAEVYGACEGCEA